MYGDPASGSAYFKSFAFKWQPHFALEHQRGKVLPRSTECLQIEVGKWTVFCLLIEAAIMNSVTQCGNNLLHGKPRGSQVLFKITDGRPPRIRFANQLVARSRTVY